MKISNKSINFAEQLIHLAKVCRCLNLSIFCCSNAIPKFSREYRYEKLEILHNKEQWYAGKIRGFKMVGLVGGPWAEPQGAERFSKIWENSFAKLKTVALF